MFTLILSYSITVVILAGLAFVACLAINDNYPEGISLSIVIAIASIVLWLIIGPNVSSGNEQAHVENVKTVSWDKTCFSLCCEHGKVLKISEYNEISEFSKKYSFPTSNDGTYSYDLKLKNINIPIVHVSYRNALGVTSFEDSFKFVDVEEHKEEISK